MNYKRIANAPKWVVSEIIWYIKWWGNVFYSFGEWILDTTVTLIDLHDLFWDAIEYKIENMREGNVLD